MLDEQTSPEVAVAAPTGPAYLFQGAKELAGRWTTLMQVRRSDPNDMSYHRAMDYIPITARYCYMQLLSMTFRDSFTATEWKVMDRLVTQQVHFGDYRLSISAASLEKGAQDKNGFLPRHLKLLESRNIANADMLERIKMRYAATCIWPELLSSNEYFILSGLLSIALYLGTDEIPITQAKLKWGDKVWAELRAAKMSESGYYKALRSLEQ